MRLKFAAVTLAAISALACLAVPADAQSRRVYTDARGHTVFTSRDEDGRTRTKIIIQKRSYLDPGTEVLPGTLHYNDNAWLPNHRADGVLNNTVGGGNQTALPGPWTLPGKNNPWISF